MKIFRKVGGLEHSPKLTFIYSILYLRRICLLLMRVRKASFEQKLGIGWMHSIYFSPIGKNKLLFSASKLVLLAKRTLKLQRRTIELFDEYQSWKHRIFLQSPKITLSGSEPRIIFFSVAQDEKASLCFKVFLAKFGDCTSATFDLLKALSYWSSSVLDLAEMRILRDVANYESLAYLPLHFQDTLKELGRLEENKVLLVQCLRKNEILYKKLGLGKTVDSITSRIIKITPALSACAKGADVGYKILSGVDNLFKSGFTALFMIPVKQFIGKNCYPQRTLPLEDIYSSSLNP